MKKTDIKKTALILGGGGFIGDHLAKRLKNEGFWVRVVEVWVIVEGSGELKLNDEIMNVVAGDVLQIPIEAKHQIKNTSTTDTNLVFIEVQLGTYFGEDDIVRLEDSYGRV